MRRSDLSPDCGSCASLCCVATSFDASPAFALTKQASVACPLLCPDHRCSIHSTLVQRGFAGCAAYDCYGAGQRVTRLFAGIHAPDQHVHHVFLVQRDVHELLFLLTEARALLPDEDHPLALYMAHLVAVLDALVSGPTAELLQANVSALHDAAHMLLRRVGGVLQGRRLAG